MTSTNDTLPSNRGRWGDEDERGTLNLITDEVRARAIAEAQTGRTVSLARPVKAIPLIAGPAPATDGSPAVSQAMMFTGSPAVAIAELIVMVPHSAVLTHIDALTHAIDDGQVYPGVPLADRVNAAGASLGSARIFAGGIVTRGVFLDLAPGTQLAVDHPVTAEDLDAAAKRAGAEVLPGDAIIVRGGWDLGNLPGNRVPGMTLDAVRWMHRHDVSVYLGDICDARPPHDRKLGSVLHRVGITHMGMPLVDSVEPTALAAVCAELGRSTFMLVIAPQRLDDATGVPVNPLAIF